MADSVESGSEKVNNEILSRLANDDYLLDKIISMRQRRKLTKTDINYIIKSAQQTLESDNQTDIDDIVNQAVNNIILENEENLCRETSCIAKEEVDFITTILDSELTIRNFEDIFCLKQFKAIEFPQSGEDNIRNIRYKDSDGITHAIAQINTDTNKIRLQTFSDVFPKQEFINPQQANYKVMSKSKTNNWTTEYGGINQFDGSIEIRYKDVNGKVMAAVIFKSDGNIDTVVEYKYNNGKKSQMIHTSQNGLSKTIYDEFTDSTKLIVDIDTDGNICSFTKGFSN